MGRPKAAVGATRSRSTSTEPRRTPAKAAVQAANVVGGDGAILKILNQSPGGIADNVLSSLTPARQRGCAANPDAWSPSLMFWRPRRAPARRSANRLLTDVPEI